MSDSRKRKHKSNENLKPPKKSKPDPTELPLKDDDLTPVEKQYNQWCQEICNSFSQDWTSLRHEIHGFHQLHFKYGWKRILFHLLSPFLCQNVVGLIAEYSRDKRFEEISKDCIHRTWSEARQAMFWLWCPAFTRPVRPIRMRNTPKHYFFSYRVDWTCKAKDCVCRLKSYDQDEKEQEDGLVQVYWQDAKQEYESFDRFHNHELTEILDMIQNADDVDWLYLIHLTSENHTLDQLLPAMFLLYFQSQIGALEKLI